MTDEAVVETPETPPQTPESSPPDPIVETIAEVPGEDIPGAATWPENWRQEFAGEDAAALKKLNRYKSPNNVYKAYRSLEQKLSSGEYQRARPTTDDADAMKAWRTEVGVPETPEGYLEKLPEGLEVPPEDQPSVDKYLERMHAEGASPKHVHDGLAWYYESQEQMANERSEADKAFRVQSEDELRAEYGPEYTGNLNGMRAMLDAYAPDGLKEEILTSRTDDGTILGNHPAFLKMMVNLSSEINPQGIITPSVGEDRMANIETRIAEIEGLMGDTKSRNDPNGYWNNQGMQEEYRRLITLQDRHKAA